MDASRPEGRAERDSATPSAAPDPAKAVLDGLAGGAEARSDVRRQVAGSLAVTFAALGYAIYFFIDTLDHSWRTKSLPVAFALAVALLASVELYRTVGQQRAAARERSAAEAASPREAADPTGPPSYVVAGIEIVIVLATTWLLILSIGEMPLFLTMALYGGVLFLVLERRQADVVGLVATAGFMGLLGFVIARYFPGVG